MAQSYSGIIHKEYDGKRYSFRTATIYNTLGTPGTIVTDSAKTTLQLDLGGLTGFVNIAERNASGGWTFTDAAGDAIKKDLTKRGPGSLTAQLDNATLAALKTNARITDVQARQALDISQNITGTTALLPANQNSDGSSGGGTDAPAGSSASGSSLSELSKEQKQSILNKIAQGAKARTNYEGNLKYPETYEGNDYLTIDMIRYIPNSNLGLGTVGAEGGLSLDADTTSELGLPRFGDRLGKLEDDTKKEASIAKFTLPIPSNLIDANPVEWSADALNPLQAYGAGAIGRILNSGNFGTAVGGEIKRAGNALKGNADAAKTVLNNEIIKQILGVNTLTRSTGAIVNQNTELLFKGVGLRSFSFTFKMTPRSASEATIVRKIIRRLKQGMSVKRSSSGLFLASPNVFKLQFWYVPPRQKEDGSFDEELSGTPQPHPYLPKLKVCALQNMSVNYMPDGSYMTYGDGSMIGYEMTLTFAEIDPIFDEDYDKLDEGKEQDSVIGY